MGLKFRVFVSGAGLFSGVSKQELGISEDRVCPGPQGYLELLYVGRVPVSFGNVLRTACAVVGHNLL